MRLENILCAQALYSAFRPCILHSGRRVATTRDERVLVVFFFFFVFVYSVRQLRNAARHCLQSGDLRLASYAACEDALLYSYCVLDSLLNMSCSIGKHALRQTDLCGSIPRPALPFVDHCFLSCVVHSNAVALFEQLNVNAACGGSVGWRCLTNSSIILILIGCSLTALSAGAQIQIRIRICNAMHCALWSHLPLAVHQGSLRVQCSVR